MKTSAITGTAEKLASFGGICGIIGVVCDLMTPIGDFTMWSLGIGVVILVSGLVARTFFGLRNETSKSAIAFGAILVCISGWFLSGAGSNGRLSSDFEWVAKLQNQMLDLNETAKAIKDDTTKIVSNTNDISSNTQEIVDTSWSQTKFDDVIAGKDFKAMKIACKRGYQVRDYDLLNGYNANHPGNAYGDDAIFNFIIENDCVDRPVMCSEGAINYKAYSASLERVEAICGKETASRMVDARSKKAAYEAHVSESTRKTKEENDAAKARCLDDLKDEARCRFGYYRYR